MPRAKSRPKRWMEAVVLLQAGHEQLRNADAEDVSDAYATIESALQDIRDLQSEYEEWRDGLPTGIDSSPLADKLDEVIDIDLEPGWEYDNPNEEQVAEALDELEELISVVEGIDLPLGFGRD